MLVEFHKGLILEGTSTIPKKKFFKKEEVRQKIYVSTGVRGICDESEVETEINRLTALQLENTNGWGKFEGWERAVPTEEIEAVVKKNGWSDDYLPVSTITIEPINSWKMEKIIQKLNGKQFAQFCKENNISDLKLK